MSFLKIDDLNEIYFEYIKPKKNGFTFVFVNALTGNVDTWNNEIANIITDNGNGYLAYNFRGQEKSKFDESLILDTTLIVSDLCFLLDHIQPENIILVGLSIGGLYASLALPKVKDCKGLILINTLRKQSLRLQWINQTMVNVARYGGTSLLMDFNMPVIASPEFLKKMKPNALNPENYKPLDQKSGIFKLMEGSLTADWNFDWSQIDLPTLILTGHYDKVFRISEDVETLASMIKLSERIEMPDCGHLIPIEKPIIFAKFINDFIKKLT